VMAAGVAQTRQRAADTRRLADSLSGGMTTRSSPRLAIGFTALTLLPDASPPPSPWLQPLSPSDPFGITTAETYVKGLEKASVEAQATLKSTNGALAVSLAAESAALYYTAILDAAMLLLNAVAFCGYGMFPVTFFGPAEKGLATIVPFWPGHDAAQFWGNLAGDVAWTVEAAVMLVVPALIARMRAKAKAKVE